MAPSPIPAPLPPWAKVALWIAPGIPSGLHFVLDHIGELFDNQAPAPSSWRQVMWVFQDMADPDTANRAIFTIDLANITNGVVDGTWTDQDYTDVEGELTAMWLQLKAFTSQRCTLVERRYYVRTFNDMSITKPFGPSGPPERIFPLNVAGGTGLSQAPQVSVSVTERTAYPKHWGRFYLPWPASDTVDSRGHITTAATDAIGASVNLYFGTLMGREFFPVVPYTQVDRQPNRGLLTVDQVQVDNVFDVIRRRRSHTATHKYVNTP